MANTIKLGAGKWATGTDTVLAFNDENNNFKPLPFDFSRASSATVVNQSGLIETVGSGTPRIDFQGNTKGALLLEPQRTNSITYSNDLNASGWNTYSSDGGTVTRTSNYGISPSGKQDSTRVVFNSQFVSLYYTFSGISGDASATMYVKGGAGKVIGFGFGSDVSFGQEFTLNGQWQRIEFNAVSTNTTLNINAWGATRTASDIEVYGAQLEQGSYATSYIPTSGSAVTRVLDSCNQTVPDGVIGQTEGTVYIQLGEVNSEYNDDFYVELNNGSGSATRIGIYVDASNYLRNLILGGGDSSNIQTNYQPQSNDKIAITYKTNEAKIFVNGIQRGSTDTTVGVPSTNRVSLQSNTSLRTKSNNLRSLKLYNTVLTDAELQALTS